MKKVATGMQNGAEIMNLFGGCRKKKDFPVTTQSRFVEALVLKTYDTLYMKTDLSSRKHVFTCVILESTCSDWLKTTPSHVYHFGTLKHYIYSINWLPEIVFQSNVGMVI